jgi:hypothetical protein
VSQEARDARCTMGDIYEASAGTCCDVGDFASAADSFQKAALFWEREEDFPRADVCWRSVAAVARRRAEQCRQRKGEG